MKLDNRSLNELEETELIASKILAFKIENDQAFKAAFIQSLFTSDGHPTENVFLCKVFDNISELDIRFLLQSNVITSEDYNQFKDRLRQDFPLLVAKVPLWYGSVWSLSGEDGFDSTSPLMNEVRFIPYVEDINNSNYFNTYKFNNSVFENDIINFKDVHFTYLPVLIRQSEYHRLIDFQNLKDPNGFSLFDSYEIDNDPQSPCYTKGILSKHLEQLVCVNGSYAVVNWISFQQELFKCRPPGTSSHENCYNGIDDDGDGQVDCADPDCDCDEICDNAIDDDGDGLVDEADPDCCWFYAGCERDCVSETNHFRGLKFVNNFVGLFHNHQPAFTDITGIRVVTYEFVGSAGAVAGSKFFYYPFMKSCGWLPIQIGYPTAPGLNPNYEAFYSSYWSLIKDPANYCGISLSGGGSFQQTWYLHLKEPLVVNVDVKWQDNWVGTLLGDRVRGEVFYLSSDVLSTSQSSTYTTQSVTKLGSSFGANYGVSGGNPANGLNVGFTWNSENTQTVQSQITISIAPQDKSLGTFDMTYCELNSNYIYTNSCPTPGQIIGIDQVNGTYYSTGAMEIWSCIDIK